MRVLLQNSETKLYFAGPNEWTDDATKAVNFEHIDRASQTYAAENLAYAEIVLEPEGLEGLARTSEADSQVA